jgi:hypothetical protein
MLDVAGWSGLRHGRSVLSARFLALAFLLPAPAWSEPPDLDALAGVHKNSFENGTAYGDQYRSEDILELVRITPTSAYVRLHLEFFNGHMCDIWGVAEVEGDALVCTTSAYPHGQSRCWSDVCPASSRSEPDRSDLGSLDLRLLRGVTWEGVGETVSKEEVVRVKSCQA